MLSELIWETQLQAVEQNNVELLEKVLQAGLSPNSKDPKGMLPLYALKTDSDLKILELLLKNGANTSNLDDRGLSPLYVLKPIAGGAWCRTRDSRFVQELCKLMSIMAGGSPSIG